MLPHNLLCSAQRARPNYGRVRGKITCHFDLHRGMGSKNMRIPSLQPFWYGCPVPKKKKQGNPKFTMSGGEVMTIVILFHPSPFWYPKYFYFFTQKGFLMPWSYNRFVELQRKICIPLVAFLKNESPRVRCWHFFYLFYPYSHCHIKNGKVA